MINSVWTDRDHSEFNVFHRLNWSVLLMSVTQDFATLCGIQEDGMISRFCLSMANSLPGRVGKKVPLLVQNAQKEQ